ncbi:MAG: NAD(P)-binding protein [Leptolyngbyaceae cyanobacterium T60_A2020_046]|nr:NAD(P)-binding protein [Leptolyngbyaceae cyanobacterium T60_A2020_046]
MTQADIVVIGAGMAGLTCAQRLCGAGYPVRVLEKSRGLGGRMATRRLEGWPLDHGARGLQPRSAAFQAVVQQLHDCGAIVPWRSPTFQLDLATQHLIPTESEPFWVAPAGMSAVGKALGAGLQIERQHRAIALAAPDHAPWQIHAEATTQPSPIFIPAAAVAVMIPAGQVIPLLQPWVGRGVESAQWHAIAAVDYAPCITIMAQYDVGVSTSPEGAIAPHQPWQVLGHPDSPFFWVGLDSSKRQATTPAVVIHSSAAFAESWLEAPDLQPAGEQLLKAAGDTIAPWLAHPVRWQVHRWRYAIATQPCPHLPHGNQPGPWVAGGDWCGDRQLETAFEAGWQAAAILNQMLEGRSLPDLDPWLDALLPTP